jgi:GTP cyclohydrolase I
MFARRMQVQERMTGQIARTLNEILAPKGVGVVVEGSHLCARMRGVKKEQADMLTRVTLGVFEQDQGLRQEFFSQLPLGQPG